MYIRCCPAAMLSRSVKPSWLRSTWSKSSVSGFSSDAAGGGPGWTSLAVNRNAHDGWNATGSPVPSACRKAQTLTVNALSNNSNGYDRRFM